MHASRVIAGVAAFACSGRAHAQVNGEDVRITYSLAWQDTGNANGYLEPGESAVVSVTATVSPAINTLIYFPETFYGTLRGLASAWIDLYGGNLRGATLAPGAIDPQWDLTGTLPQVDGNRLRDLMFGQP